MQFADDPAAYFAHDGSTAHQLDPGERERLQQQALAHRLQQLLPQLSTLALLAQMQGIDASLPLERAPELFFPHTIFKSYDPRWLHYGDFARMTAWANTLIGRDISLPQGVEFPSIDGWLEWLEREHNVEITHSTGTTGRMSLVLRDRGDARNGMVRMRMLRDDWHRPQGFDTDERKLALIHPGSAAGRTAMHRFAAYWQDLPLDPAKLAFLHDQDLGADYELYVMAARASLARGEAQVPAPSPYVEAQLAEAEARFRNREWSMVQFVERIGAEIQGQRVMVLGGPLTIHALAAAGLARRLEGYFADQSFTFSLGGLKGHASPAGLDSTITRFVGSDHTMYGYGMTELNEGFISCEAGLYHVPPWIVPWVLDPAANWRPKPRNGVQEGRAAFLDLATQQSWAGIVTADHVTISYGQCACGRNSPAIHADVKRIDDGDQGHHFLPSPPAAFQAVLSHVLNLPE